MSKEELTKEKILGMKPWELDRYIHEFLFDGEDLSEFEHRGNSYVKVIDTKVTWRDVPKYSTDMTTAWEVAEYFKSKGYLFTLKNLVGGQFEFYLTDWGGMCSTYIVQDNMPSVAICKSALLAVIGGSKG